MEYYDLPNKSFDTEAEFTMWFWRKIRDDWGFWFKIPDDSMWEKPYDAICCHKWKTYHFEIKIWAEKKSTNVFNKLRPSQKYSLRLVAENWGYAFVVYYNKFLHEYFMFPFHKDTQSLIIDLKK